MNLDQRFGASMKALRIERGWSQRDLASQLINKRMPVDASAVSRMESGARSLRLSEAGLVAEALGVTVSDMLSDGVEQAAMNINSVIDGAIRSLEQMRQETGRGIA